MSVYKLPTGYKEPQSARMDYNPYPELTNLIPYKEPQYYYGETYENHYTIIGKHRDSDLITESNYRVILKMIESFPEGSDYLEKHSASHWAVGWVEVLYVSFDAPYELLEKLNEALGSIYDYPILDESDYYDLSEGEEEKQWNFTGRGEFIEMLESFIEDYEPDIDQSFLDDYDKVDNLFHELQDAANVYTGDYGDYFDFQIDLIQEYLETEGNPSLEYFLTPNPPYKINQLELNLGA